MTDINPFEDTIKRINNVFENAKKLPKELWNVTKEDLN